MNYDFLNLSPYEFELLSRDLLQEELKIHLESFKSGRDEGIDLRFSRNNKSTLIVQCKRYSNYSQFLRALRAEVSNLKKLNPSRYVICTSVALSPKNKDAIQKLFEPYITDTKFIFGKEDLNNLLGKFPEVEKRHFKLWLGTTGVLQNIINAGIFNQSNFELSEIKETIKLYVDNNSFEQAIKILKDNHYVIISGIPGIGKTTLARILTYHFLSAGIDEFIYLSESISEAYQLYNESKSQIFLFDDFLGRNFLHNKLSTNEEKQILKFINRIKRSDNKLLIFTTREYILQQAKNIYDLFDSSSIEMAKCIIDLSQYTKMVKAQILYNHLFFSDINTPHLHNLLDNERYMEIIDHDNYNPRIIETITDEDVWSNIDPNDFFSSFKGFLDFPESVWKHVFENQIEEFSRSLLYVLVTCGTPIRLIDLKLALTSFLYLKEEFRTSRFNKALKELENTFISTNSIESEFIVEFQNPSIQDFLTNHLKNEPEIIVRLLKSATFLNQYFTIFSRQESENQILLDLQNQILLSELLRTKFDTLKSSKLRSTRSTMPEDLTESAKILSVVKNLDLHSYPRLRQFLIAKADRIINGEPITYRSSYLVQEIIIEFKNYLTYDVDKILNDYHHNLSFISDLREFAEFRNVFDSRYDDWVDVNYDDLHDNIHEVVENEADQIDNDEIENFIDDDIEEIADIFDIDLDDIKEDLEKRAVDYDADRIDYPEEHDGRLQSDNMDEDIHDMFDGLR